MITTLLFDLDETLIADRQATRLAQQATIAATPELIGCDSDRFIADLWSFGRQRWHAASTYPYCQLIGISSWEGFWGRFDGDSI